MSSVHTCNVGHFLEMSIAVSQVPDMWHHAASVKKMLDSIKNFYHYEP